MANVSWANRFFRMLESTDDFSSCQSEKYLFSFLCTLGIEIYVFQCYYILIIRFSISNAFYGEIIMTEVATAHRRLCDLVYASIVWEEAILNENISNCFLQFSLHIIWFVYLLLSDWIFYEVIKVTTD